MVTSQVFGSYIIDFGDKMFKNLFILISLLCLIGGCSAISPPIITGPSNGDVNIYYSFYIKSTDITESQIRYKVDWGDGTTSTTSLRDKNIEVKLYHKWVNNGIYSIKSMVISPTGITSTWSAPLQVNIGGGVIPPANNPPTTPFVPSGSAFGTSGTSYSYITKATDPDGNKVKYTLDWGDGTTSTTSLVSSGTVASAPHTWTVAAGTTKTFSVKAKTTDEKGLDSGWSSTLLVTITGPVAVNNPPGKPSIPRGTVVGNTKYSYTYQTKATDPDGDKVKFTFNWGDGTTTTTDFVASGSLASTSHKWPNAEPGWGKGYDITAKAIDIRGAESVWSTAYPVSMVTDPINHPPAIAEVIDGPMEGQSGVTYTFYAMSNDPDGDYIKYIFNWGDGSTDIGYFPSGQTVSALHSWIVPAGETWDCKVKVYCADSNYARCPYPYFSDPWIVAVSGPSSMVQMIEEANLQINESNVITNESEYGNVSLLEA